LGDGDDGGARDEGDKGGCGGVVEEVGLDEAADDGEGVVGLGMEGEGELGEDGGGDVGLGVGGVGGASDDGWRFSFM
jgi:hypothetical protein